jgi:PAS domain S-box-containing protein
MGGTDGEQPPRSAESAATGRSGDRLDRADLADHSGYGAASAPAGVSGMGRSAQVEVLVRVVEEQRLAEARLRSRFLEHGLIDQAIGVLVAQMSCGPDEAFGQLLELERRSGRGLLEIAGDLVGRSARGDESVGADGSGTGGAGESSAGGDVLDQGGAVSGDIGTDRAGADGTGADRSEVDGSGDRVAGGSSGRGSSDRAGTTARTEPLRLDRVAEGDELARLLLADTLAWSGAAQVAVALRDPDGALELIGSAGLPQRVVSQWRRIPPQMDCLLNAAVHRQAAVWSDTASELGAGDHGSGPGGANERGAGEPAPSDWAAASLAGWPGRSEQADQTSCDQFPTERQSHDRRSRDGRTGEPRRRAGLLLIGRPAAGPASANQLHVAVPMRFGRDLIGAIEVGWPSTTAFPAEARAEIAALLEATGQAVARSRRLADEPVRELSELSGRELDLPPGGELDPGQSGSLAGDRQPVSDPNSGPTGREAGWLASPEPVDEPGRHPGGTQSGRAQYREPERTAGRGGPLDRLREVIDVAWEPMLLLRAVPDAHGPFGDFRTVAVNAAAVELLTPSGAGNSFPLVGRSLLELIPWGAVSGAFDALRGVLATGTPYLDPEHTYVQDSDPEAGRRIVHVSIGATPVGEGLLLLSLRPAAGAAGEWRARAARLRRLSGAGGWEWDVAGGLVHWSAEALAVLGAQSAPGPAPEDRPPYLVHRDDEAEHARLMRTLGRDGRPAQAEFRVIRPGGAVRHMRLAGEPVVGQDNAVTAVFGTVQDVTERRRAETALEVAQIQLAAQRSRADSERLLADLLLQVIMPVDPARIPVEAGLEVAARYRPASAGAGVGGDWYGIIPLPDSRLLLTVGDIAGHGFSAATAMAQLYHALHGLALTGADCAELLGWLNTLTCSLPTFTIASACCAIYDPAGRRLSLANAGHPSPVLIRGAAAAALPKPAGTMLGVDPAGGFDELNVELEPGDVILLYTDGLIERRKHSPEENVGRLLSAAANPEADLGAFVDRILAEAQADTDDDTCVIAVRFG